MSRTRINPRNMKTRDYAMVRIIQGVTKSGIHKDEKKDASRFACRGKGIYIEDGEAGEALYEDHGEEE